MALIQAQGGDVTNQGLKMLTTVIQGLGQIVEGSFVTQVQKDRIAAPGACRRGGGCRVGVRVISVDAIVETLDERESKILRRTRTTSGS